METVSFDLPEYKKITQVREEWLEYQLSVLANVLELRSAADIGCGAGYFSNYLKLKEFSVTGYDLQDENILICKERYPDIDFLKLNLDEKFNMDKYDLMLMFGILYHLQSPLQSIHRLVQAIGKIGIVETRVAAGEEMACYLFEEKLGLAHNTARVTSVPTFSALVQMFHHSGIKYIFLPDTQPDHPQWRMAGHGRRYCLIVSREKLSVEGWQAVEASRFLNKW